MHGYAIWAICKEKCVLQRMSENAATTTEIQPTATATAPAPRRKKKSNMRLASTDKATDGLHYCAKAIIDVLRTAGQPAAVEGTPVVYNSMSRDEVIAGLAALNLKTTQPAIRVLYYWKKFLIDGGYAVKVAAQA